MINPQILIPKKYIIINGHHIRVQKTLCEPPEEKRNMKIQNIKTSKLKNRKILNKLKFQVSQKGYAKFELNQFSPKKIKRLYFFKEDNLISSHQPHH